MTENQEQFLTFVLAAAKNAGLAPKAGSAEMAAFALGGEGRWPLLPLPRLQA